MSMTYESARRKEIRPGKARQIEEFIEQVPAGGIKHTDPKAPDRSGSQPVLK